MATTPQTQDGMSFVDVILEYQIDGDPTPTDMTGFTTTVEAKGYETQVGETYTGNSKKAILTAGKDSPAEVTIKSIYTEIETDPMAKLWAAKKAHKKVKFLWSLKNAVVPYFKWETDYGYITSMTPPSGEVGSADAVITEITHKAPAIDYSKVTV